MYPTLAMGCVASGVRTDRVGLLAMVLRRSRDDPKVSERAGLLWSSRGDCAPAEKAAASALLLLALPDAARGGRRSTAISATACPC